MSHTKNLFTVNWKLRKNFVMDIWIFIFEYKFQLNLPHVKYMLEVSGTVDKKLTKKIIRNHYHTRTLGCSTNFVLTKFLAQHMPKTPLDPTCFYTTWHRSSSHFVVLGIYASTGFPRLKRINLAQINLCLVTKHDDTKYEFVNRILDYWNNYHNFS